MQVNIFRKIPKKHNFETGVWYFAQKNGGDLIRIVQKPCFNVNNVEAVVYLDNFNGELNWDPLEFFLDNYTLLEKVEEMAVSSLDSDS